MSRITIHTRTNDRIAANEALASNVIGVDPSFTSLIATFMAEEFPEDLRRFILEKIDSVEKLEVLLLLKREPLRAWDNDAVSHRLYTSAASSDSRLRDLVEQGLVSIANEPVQFQYNAQGDHDRLVTELAEAYRTRSVAVISLIYSQTSNQVKAFADAFKLRKEK